MDQLNETDILSEVRKVKLYHQFNANTNKDQNLQSSNNNDPSHLKNNKNISESEPLFTQLKLQENPSPPTPSLPKEEPFQEIEGTKDYFSVQSQDTKWNQKLLKQNLY